MCVCVREERVKEKVWGRSSGGWGLKAVGVRVSINRGRVGRNLCVRGGCVREGRGRPPPPKPALGRLGRSLRSTPSLRREVQNVRRWHSLRSAPSLDLIVSVQPLSRSPASGPARRPPRNVPAPKPPTSQPPRPSASTPSFPPPSPRPDSALQSLVTVAAPRPWASAGSAPRGGPGPRPASTGPDRPRRRTNCSGRTLTPARRV